MGNPWDNMVADVNDRIAQVRRQVAIVRAVVVASLAMQALTLMLAGAVAVQIFLL